MEKLFVIRKYVKAESVLDAIKKEKKAPVDDCWIEDEWKKTEWPSRLGFRFEAKT